jgi:hypothetical protein
VIGERYHAFFISDYPVLPLSTLRCNIRDNEIHLDLFYDEGEYFNGTKAPLEGTLSGWVIKNQKELFLPDLRREAELEGVEIFVIGQEKTSLSWMGVPLTTPNVTGVIALGSYQPTECLIIW